MTLIEAKEIIAYHQTWRMGYVDEQKHTPKELTQALNILLDTPMETQGFRSLLNEVRDAITSIITGNSDDLKKGWALKDLCDYIDRKLEESL
jgi:hypothetical protein